MRNVSYETKKTAEGIAFHIFEIVPIPEATHAPYAKTVTLLTGVAATRARAVSAARRWIYAAGLTSEQQMRAR